jgi:outer membrane receptor for ferrienterochelin and colicin
LIRIILQAFALIFLTLPLYSQNTVRLSGKVTDAATGESLMQAAVWVKPINKGAVTDFDGVFTIDLLPGNYEIEISFLGYESHKQTIELTKNLTINFRLNEKSVPVSGITVSAQKPDDNIRSNKSGTLQLSSKEISQLPNLMGEPDIINALRLTPGIQGVGEGNPGLYVRGGDAGQNLILLDNMPLYNPSHLLGFFPVFNSDIIDQVKVIKGSIPAQYGSKASSVIDIALKEGNNQRFSGSGSVGLLSADLSLESPINKGKGSLIVSGRRTYLELVKAAAEPFISNNDNVFSHTDYFFYDGSIKFTYKLSTNTRIALTAFYGNDSYALTDPDFNVSNNMQWSNKAAAVKISHVLSDNLRTNFSVGLTSYNFTIEAAFNDYGFNLFSGIEDYYANWDLNYQAGKNASFRLGAGYTRHLITPNKINVDVESVYYENTNQYHSNEWAAFAQTNYTFSDAFSVTTGLRYTLFQHVGPYTQYTRDAFGKLTDSIVYQSNQLVKTYHTLDANASVVYILNESASLKSSAAITHQFIHLASVGTVSLPTDVWLPSTQFIKPQQVLQFTSGYFRNFANHVFETSVELYYKKLNRQIDFLNGVIDNMDNTRIENNIVEGTGQAFGLEFFVKKQKGTTTGWISYTLSRTLRQFEGINNGNYFPAKYDRVHDVSLTLNHQLNERWNLSAAFIYATGNAMTLPAGRYLIQGNIANHYTAVNAFRMPAYHRLDVSANYQLKKSARWESWINFSVYNVYNRANPYYIYFRVKGDVDNYYLSVKPRKISLFPILPSITLNFKF